MRLNRPFIVLGIIGVASFIGIQRQHALQSLRQTNAALAEQIGFTQAQIRERQASLTPLQEELAELRKTRAETAAKAAALLRELAPENSDARWSIPPTQLPDWDPDSPYVWLNKELLTRFPLQPFSSTGALSPTVASLLVLEPQQVQQLNENITRLVAEYRAQEAARAQPAEQTISGQESGQIKKLTLIIPPSPEFSATLKDQVERTLVAQLGQSRADLLLQTAAGWWQEQIGGSGTESRVFSVERQADNSYQVSISSGTMRMSVGGVGSINDYVPPHLRPFFDSLTSPDVLSPKP